MAETLERVGPVDVGPIENDAAESMTRREAQETHEFICRSEVGKRLGVYIMWRRRGWRSLGYESFEDYTERGLEENRQSAYNWIGQVEMTMLVKGLTLKTVSNFFTNEIETHLIPLGVAKYLRVLKSQPGLLKKAWEQAEGTALANAEHNGQTDYTKFLKPAQVKKIVDRIAEEEKYGVTARDPILRKAQRIQGKRKERADQNADTSQSSPPKQQQQTVTSFAAPPDPEPVVVPTIDEESIFISMDTARVWLQNKEIGDKPGIVSKTLNDLNALVAWIEAVRQQR